MLDIAATTLSKPLAIFVLTLGLINSSHAANYIIDSSQTNIRFAIDNFKNPSITGGFYNLKGQLQYDPHLKTGSILLDIPISSLDTGNTVFNTKLKSASFFDIQRFPSARFASTKWYFNNDLVPKVVRVDGNLSLHGETHPISLHASRFECASTDILKDKSCSGKFSATIDRTKWNINKYTLFGMTKNLTLNVQVKAVKQ